MCNAHSGGMSAHFDWALVSRVFQSSHLSLNRQPFGYWSGDGTEPGMVFSSLDFCPIFGIASSSALVYG